jgi:hypothetical protein
MMIDPETYYEMYLKGKSPEQLLTEIRSLRREIARMRRELGDTSGDKLFFPDSWSMLEINREYLERAVRAYEEAGGVYVPTALEKRSRRIDEALDKLESATFFKGHYFGGYTTRRCTIKGDKAVFETARPWTQSQFEPEEERWTKDGRWTKDEFIDSLRRLHIGEWKCSYIDSTILDGEEWEFTLKFKSGRRQLNISGINAYPYNFDRLVELFGMEED